VTTPTLPRPRTRRPADRKQQIARFSWDGPAAADAALISHVVLAGFGSVSQYRPRAPAAAPSRYSLLNAAVSARPSD
jgi:hypothetical protein